GATHPNTAFGFGGGVCLASGSLNVNNDKGDSNFFYNTAAAGGAIYAAGSATISNSHIYKNTASTGGGIAASSATINLSGGLLELNTATTGDGGGISVSGGYLSVLGSSTASFCQISGNNAKSGNGGGIFSNTTTSIKYASIFSNSANNGGGIE